jgi:hypothetical protein
MEMPMQRGWLGRVEIGWPTVSDGFSRHIGCAGGAQRFGGCASFDRQYHQFAEFRHFCEVTNVSFRILAVPIIELWMNTTAYRAG